MLQGCYQHDLNIHQEMQTYYNGLDTTTRLIIDLRGLTPKTLLIEVKEIIEELAQHSHQ